MGKKKFQLKFGAKCFSKYFPKYAENLKTRILKSNLEMVFDIYVGQMIFYSILSLLASFVVILFLTYFLFSITFLVTILASVIGAAVVGLITLIIGYYYPSLSLKGKAQDIEANMPFAINHMAAVVSSGAKPSAMFEFLAKNKEYGEISKEAGYIFRNIKVLGMDMTTAIREVAQRTPNKNFAQFLFGLVSEIKGGGNLKVYLKKAAEDSLFEYRIRREKYLTLLSNYADVYIAVLIVAPLFFIAILSVMSMIGGEIGGLGIRTLMEIGVYAVIPLLNIIFLIFVHSTQPKM